MKKNRFSIDASLYINCYSFLFGYLYMFHSDHKCLSPAPADPLDWLSDVLQQLYSMEGLPEPLLAEIIKRITSTSDLNSLSLVSKQLYSVDAQHRDAIRVGCRLNPTTEALVSLFSRFPNLSKVEINYSGWTSSHGDQLNNQGLHVLSSHCPLLSDLTLSFCSYIDDTVLVTYPTAKCWGHSG